MQVLQVFFLQDLQDLALNLARLALKMKIFARTEKSCSDLQDFNHIKIILQFFLQVLASSCKISTTFFNFCKKSSIFSASLARFHARSCKSCKKNTCKTCIFLARWFLLDIDVYFTTFVTSVTIYQHYFCDFSPFQQSVKEKEKQIRMKGLTMAQWVNLNQNNRSVIVH